MVILEKKGSLSRPSKEWKNSKNRLNGKEASFIV